MFDRKKEKRFSVFVTSYACLENVYIMWPIHYYRYLCLRRLAFFSGALSLLLSLLFEVREAERFVWRDIARAQLHLIAVFKPISIDPLSVPCEPIYFFSSESFFCVWFLLKPKSLHLLIVVLIILYKRCLFVLSAIWVSSASDNSQRRKKKRSETFNGKILKIDCNNRHFICERVACEVFFPVPHIFHPKETRFHIVVCE